VAGSPLFLLYEVGGRHGAHPDALIETSIQRDRFVIGHPHRFHRAALTDRHRDAAGRRLRNGRWTNPPNDRILGRPILTFHQRRQDYPQIDEKRQTACHTFHGRAKSLCCSKRNRAAARIAHAADRMPSESELAAEMD
jgi:hypothetical protein